MKKVGILSLLLVLLFCSGAYAQKTGGFKGLKKFAKKVLEQAVETSEPAGPAPLTFVPGEAVDLGLSVKWASYNVGASKPEEFGGYYAWGETEVKEVYDETTYVGVWSNSTLAPENDVAHVKWGGEWRMPTRDEAEELLVKCDWKSTKVNGVDGDLITGPNGNTIFLPECNQRTGDYIDKFGTRYWTSTRYEYGEKTARFLSTTGTCRAYYGLTVRPVCK
ncbi:MAG: hypothetical protein E7090_09325 [Bacteroidales bacterium]|nr:hypothetical protein [Bacteroidales bacterium]